ncbi:MAG TPA: restriction endonuclease subunit S [Thermoanaerobaculia bacterium]|nr:restriction endonuclease subunit S [Thermoanaerobaculia bacterium]
MTVFDERPFSALAQDGSILPEGWTEISLAEIIVYKIGGDWGEDAPAAELVPVLSLRGTEFRQWERDKGETAAQRWITESSRAKRVLRPGDLVIEISGGGPRQPVGRVLLIDEEAIRRARQPLICNNFCRLMRAHPAMNPAFIHLALRERYLRGDVRDFQTQTTNLRNLQFGKFLEGTLLRVPPLAEQKRIVVAAEELLEKSGTVSGRLRAARRVLRKVRQAILAGASEGKLTDDWRLGRPSGEAVAAVLALAFDERRKTREDVSQHTELAGRRQRRKPLPAALSDWAVPEALSLPVLPETWTFAALQDLVEVLQYGTSKPTNADLKEGVPVLRMSNIRDGEVDPSDLKLIDPATEDVPKFTLRRRDILFNRTNSPELVGKAAVFDLERPMIFASYLVRVTCDQQLVLPEYLCGWINSPWGRQWAHSVRSDCNHQSNINVSKLRMMPVPLPPLDEQREIVRRMKEAFASADTVEKAIDHALAEAERLPRSILERAMRGELVPTEAELARLDGREYEPATVLLDRIRADRAEPPTQERKPQLRSLPGLSTEGVLAAIRRTSWGGAERTADELIEAVAVRLKVPEPGPELQAVVGRHVEIALERRILARKGDRLVGATPKIGRYDSEFLLGVLGKVMREGAVYDRKQLSRMVASWLGYDQVTAAIRDRLDEIFQEAVRRGLLSFERERYRFIHSNSS